jgi:hypothetical protein
MEGRSVILLHTIVHGFVFHMAAKLCDLFSLGAWPQYNVVYSSIFDQKSHVYCFRCILSEMVLLDVVV